MNSEPKVKNDSGQGLALCVDLDGTLVRTDTLVETFVAALRNWTILPRMVIWLLRGKARFKANLSKHAGLNASLLPYNNALVEYLREQRRLGRYLVLVTAANQNIAQEIDGHLNIFDEIIASDESRNLRGAEKAKALVERFGARGFCYIGNDRFDLPIWEFASSGILVNVSSRVAKAAANLTQIEQDISDKKDQWCALLKALRPHQWLKNLLVFIPIITAGAYNDFHAIGQACVMFAAFCCTASAIYVINDLYDLEADRKHATKRNRPLASGALSLATGLGAVPTLVTVGIAFAATLHSPGALFALLGYGGLSITYSIILKTLPLVDVFTLATLYTLRLFAGGEATGHHMSYWLLAFSGFLFLSLAVVKRVSELTVLIGLGRQLAVRRGYTTNDINTLQMFGISSSFISSLVIALYINDHAAKMVYEHPQFLWFLVPLLLLWQCRLWLSTTRGYMHEDPIVYTVKDWVSLLVLLMAILIIIAAKVITFPFEFK